MDDSDLLRIARDAVALGAEIVKNTRPRHIREKSDRDIVTDVDVEVERTVRDHLADETPGIGFVGEEEATQDPGTEYFWALDPIDGTSNFAHGLPMCAVQIALFHHDRSIVSAIVAPFLGLDYHAVEGGGAYCNGKQLTCSEVADPAHAIVSIGDYATGEGADRINERRIRLTSVLAAQVERIRMFGSAAIDLAWVAEGRTDATIILSNKPWDTGAGVLLAREAGALVTDETGQAHNINSTTTIASNRRLITATVAATRSAQ